MLSAMASGEILEIIDGGNALGLSSPEEVLLHGVRALGR
jgi:hypothetical protein